jgi:hypothetical protein
MPFTPTHVLAITPIAAVYRGRLPFSALAIGSMIPDLLLFVPLPPGYSTTHSLPGLFMACLPPGMLGFVAFQAVIKRPLISLRPAAVSDRCSEIAESSLAPSVGSAVRVALAVAIGAATHVVWDAFTHGGRWGTHLVPWLDSTVLTVGGYATPGYKVLQYGSTAVGLPLLAALAVVWVSGQPAARLESLPSAPGGARVGAVLAALGIPVVLSRPVRGGGDVPAYDAGGRSIRNSGLALMIAVLFCCLAFLVITVRGRSTRGVRSKGGDREGTDARGTLQHARCPQGPLQV